jgi:hypothetical protein
MRYIVYYTKTVEAKNIKEAIKKEATITARFHSIVAEAVEDKTPAIGFEIYDESDN